MPYMPDAQIGTGDVPSDEWIANHFDHRSAQLSRHFHETLARMRESCPIARTDQYGGFWVVTGYDDVSRVARDWRTFSNAQGVSIPMQVSEPRLPPLEMDPPRQHMFRRILSPYLTPAAIQDFEAPTRDRVTELLDAFAAEGRCEFMGAFAHQLPRLTFFDNVLGAPADQVAQLNQWTKTLAAGIPSPESAEAHAGLIGWINELVESRRASARRDDLVDALIHARIGDEPITNDEIVGSLQLLMFGGFETTASALGTLMIRLARNPGLVTRLRTDPALIPWVIEESLRTDAPVACMARSVARDTTLNGVRLREGDKVLFYLAAANRDEHAFADADTFLPDRTANRHLAFGVGPHRCAGSNLARQTIRVAVAELIARLDDIRLDGVDEIEFDTAFNRAPRAVPITFRPRPRD